MMYKSQNGFAVLETLLIVVVIAIIGGTGYFVWHNRKDSNKTTNSKDIKQNTVAVPKAPTKTYRNTLFNFQLQYDSRWGNPGDTFFDDAKFPESSQYKNYVVSGSIYTFGLHEKFDATLATKDLTLKGSLPWTASRDYNGCKPNGYVSMILYRTNDMCAAVVAGSESDEMGGTVRTRNLLMEKRLTNSKANVIVFYGAPAVVKDYSAVSLKAGYANFTKTVAGEVTNFDVLQSVKELQ
jgi:hypothetical protein